MQCALLVIKFVFVQDDSGVKYKQNFKVLSNFQQHYGAHPFHRIAPSFAIICAGYGYCRVPPNYPKFRIISWSSSSISCFRWWVSIEWSELRTSSSVLDLSLILILLFRLIRIQPALQGLYLTVMIIKLIRFFFVDFSVAIALSRMSSLCLIDATSKQSKCLLLIINRGVSTLCDFQPISSTIHSSLSPHPEFMWEVLLSSSLTTKRCFSRLREHYSKSGIKGRKVFFFL